MNCREAALYLPASADELDAVVEIARAHHLASCATCAAEAARFSRLRGSLALVESRDVTPPASLTADILARTTVGERRRTLPLVPVPIEMVRVVQENREAIAGAAGVALVAAGAAWALWRGLRSIRPTQAGT